MQRARNAGISIRRFTTLGCRMRLSQTEASRRAAGMASPAWPPTAQLMPGGTSMTALNALVRSAPAAQREDRGHARHRRRLAPPALVAGHRQPERPAVAIRLLDLLTEEPKAAFAAAQTRHDAVR